jgi:hypothetical protein
MAALSTNRIAWSYTSDDGNVYRVAAQKALTDQAVLGGSAAAGSVPEKPSSIKLRRATVSNASGHSRVVVVYENGAPIATAGTAINVNYLGNSEAFTSNGGVIPEGGPRKNVTKQSA